MSIVRSIVLFFSLAGWIPAQESATPITKRIVLTYGDYMPPTLELVDILLTTGDPDKPGAGANQKEHP